MAEASIYVELKLEGYEASSLWAFLEKHAAEFEDPDMPGGDELRAIKEVIEETLPEASYTPPIEAEERGEDDSGARS